MNSDCQDCISNDHNVRQIFGVTYVLLDDIPDSLLVEIFLQVVLDEHLQRSTSTEPRTLSVLGDGKSTTGCGLPDILLVVIMLGGDLDLLGNEI